MAHSVAMDCAGRGVIETCRERCARVTKQKGVQLQRAEGLREAHGRQMAGKRAEGRGQEEEHEGGGAWALAWKVLPRPIEGNERKTYARCQACVEGVLAWKVLPRPIERNERKTYARCQACV
jgi:hypothetical protein